MLRYPTYPNTAHKASGQARVQFRSVEYYLGPFGSPESRTELDRLLLLWRGDRVLSAPSMPPAIRGATPTIMELTVRWFHSLRTDYGDARRENKNYEQVLKALNRLFSSRMVADFDCLDLDTLRDALISGSWLNHEERARREKHGQALGWSRSVINRQMVRVRTMFKWAESKGLAPRGSSAHLATLPPLPRNSARVRTLPPKKPIDWEHAQKILPFVPAVVGAMLELQSLTGLRTSEVCRIRVEHIDNAMLEGVWVLAITQGKNDWRENWETELLPLGPEAQRVLQPWLEAAGAGIVFKPSKARTAKEYDRNTYAQAVRRGCDEAGVPRFAPYANRHGAKQPITREFGLDAARATLRQRSLGTTAGYAQEADLKHAAEVARKIG